MFTQFIIPTFAVPSVGAGAHTPRLLARRRRLFQRAQHCERIDGWKAVRMEHGEDAYGSRCFGHGITLFVETGNGVNTV